MDDEGSITRLLRDVEAGDADAEQKLFERVYTELKSMAQTRLRDEHGPPEDGEGTDLTHDAYARLRSERFENRRHLFFAYARAMRRILIERARRANTAKRGAGARRAMIDLAGLAGAQGRGAGVLELHELLEKLRAVDGRGARALELRAFGGLSTEQIGEVLSLAPRTVRDDLARARSRITEWINP